MCDSTHLLVSVANLRRLLGLCEQFILSPSSKGNTCFHTRPFVTPLSASIWSHSYSLYKCRYSEILWSLPAKRTNQRVTRQPRDWGLKCNRLIRRFLRITCHLPGIISICIVGNCRLVFTKAGGVWRQTDWSVISCPINHTGEYWSYLLHYRKLNVLQWTCNRLTIKFQCYLTKRSTNIYWWFKLNLISENYDTIKDINVEKHVLIHCFVIEICF